MGFLRRLRLGARLGLSFGVVLALLGTAVAVGIVALQRQSAAAAHARQLQLLMHQVDEQKYYDGDISGWQVAYAWDVYRLGPAKAVDPKSENRAGFLADGDKLRALLTATDVEAMNAAERAQFDQLRVLWTSYFSYDDQIVAAYAAGQTGKGNTLILGPSYDVYGKIVQQTDVLVGSVTQRATQATEAAQAQARTARNAMLIVFALAVLAAVLLTVVVTRSLTRPVTRLVGVLRGMAGGDLTVHVSDSGNDEIATMAQALNEAVTGVRGTVGQISADARELALAADTMHRVSEDIDGAVSEAHQQADLVATAAAGVSGNVQTVAAGAEEMGASITEISRNATDAAQVAGEAVNAAEATSVTVNRLGESSAQIGNVINVITAIAAQTNLLALNATIEAARAGEAGRGFAVVAGEVKDLAEETARATEEISQRVTAIQSDTTQAVSAIDGISRIIEQINAYQTTIASAVEEQSATTAEMNRGVSEAAAGAGNIATSITTVAHSTQKSRAAVTEATRAAGEVHGLADRLRAAVERFTV
jgi:methyl-accepting chemotaxis protein